MSENKTNTMKIAGVDSHTFRRTKLGESPVERGFQTPLGSCVVIDEKAYDGLREESYEIFSGLNQKYGINTVRPILPSSEIIRRLNPREGFRYIQEILKRLSDRVNLLHFSYVYLPFEEVREIRVGGYRSPRKTLKPIDFIKSLESGFPYLTAWSYFFKQRETTNMLLDDFSFKSTPAWEDLIQYHREGKAKLDIIPKGDECNYLICLADLFAYYTDIQLYNLRKLLLPSEIQEIYRDLGVDVEINFLGKKDLSKIKWTSSGNIDTSSYIHHPIVFILSDKKASIFSSTEAYDYLIAYATYNNAGLQFLQITDRKGLARIRDGDILVVIGENARKEASYWRNSFELELLTPLEIKKRMKDLVSR